MVNVIGIVVILIFYAAIVVVGIIAAKKFKPAAGSTDLDVSMVAGRNLGLVVGCFTMAGQCGDHTICVLYHDFSLHEDWHLSIH